jgi:hypothetical protein
MIFAIIIIILVGAIAFFHYTQGMWSATISAIVAVFSAALAIGYHETVVETLLKGKMADQANAFALVAVFGLSYFILRTLIDKAVPGNLRLPVILDKVGAGLMGFIAAVFSVGVVAVAGQALPFGPDVGGYTRYAMAEEREVPIQVAGKSQYQEIVVAPQVDAETFEPEQKKGLLLPVDDWVIGFVEHLSDGGSLSGKRSMKDVHPDYLDELFAQRLGIQVGANHVASNAVKKMIEVKGLFRAPPNIQQFDADLAGMRPSSKVVKWPAPKDGETLLVVRLQFNDGADGGKAPEFVRFSPASIRLVAQSDEEGSKNYYPIGTVDDGNLLFANRLDDFLFTSEGAAVDAAFIVRNDEIFEGKTSKVKEGVFIEVKRLAREDLSGKEVKPTITPDKAVAVLRKPGVVEAAKKAALAPPAAPAPPAKSGAGGTTPPAPAPEGQQPADAPPAP